MKKDAAFNRILPRLRRNDWSNDRRRHITDLGKKYGKSINVRNKTATSLKVWKENYGQYITTYIILSLLRRRKFKKTLTAVSYLTVDVSLSSLLQEKKGEFSEGIRIRSIVYCRISSFPSDGTKDESHASFLKRTLDLTFLQV